MSDPVRVVIVRKPKTSEQYIWIWEDNFANRKTILLQALRWALMDDLSWNLRNADTLTDIVIGDEG